MATHISVIPKKYLITHLPIYENKKKLTTVSLFKKRDVLLAFEEALSQNAQRACGLGIELHLSDMIDDFWRINVINSFPPK